MKRLLLLPLALLCALPAAAAAQAGSCVLVENRFVNRQDMGGGYVVLSVAGPLRVECDGGTTLRADSATVYSASNEVQLFGNVDYRDPTRTLTSNYATYSSAMGRLYATGNVVFTDVTRGSTLRGPELEYFRAMQGRPQPQVNAGQRPHLTIVPSGSAENREPLQVDGDRITSVGENFFSASGNVVIHRSDLDATAAEATHDGAAQTLNLRGNARIRGERFDLIGETVDATLPQNRLERVVARRDAELVSDRLRVDGPEIHLFFQDDLLQRLVTRGPAGAGAGEGAQARPLVAATGLLLEADSVEAVLPGQVLERVYAVGRAHAETVDTAGRPPAPTGPRARLAKQERPGEPGVTRDRDWVLGDTIVGYFVRKDSAAAPRPVSADSLAPEDEVELERVVTTGSARAFYRVRDENDRVGEVPAMNYLVAREIELTMEDGAMEVAEARGLQRGVYLDPAAPGTAAPAPAQGGPEATPQTPPAQTPPPPASPGRSR
ncbi:MAG TPA: OstA-like protein [Longimicrobiaceae bacterium]|nr:OstA-like protein [Longimicrobiaceae bacterium]